MATTAHPLSFSVPVAWPRFSSLEREPLSHSLLSPDTSEAKWTRTGNGEAETVHQDKYFRAENQSAVSPLPLVGPPPEVLVSPEHLEAYAANCKRTLHYTVNGTLLAKRDHILHRIGCLHGKKQEVFHIKGIVEREVHSEAQEVLERLKAAESMKLRRLQREEDELHRHAEAIQLLAAEIENAAAAARGDATEFIGRYRALYDACDALARRPLPEPIDVEANDFEREARLYASATKERDALSQLLLLKDNMIWNLVEERNKLQKDSQEVAVKHAAEIMALKAELDATKAAATNGATAVTSFPPAFKEASSGYRAVQAQNVPFVSVKLTVEE